MFQAETSWLSEHSTEWFAVLADATVKGMVLVVLAGGVSVALRRSSASARHLVWLLAIAGLLCLPALSAVLPAWRLALLPAGVAPLVEARVAPAPVPVPRHAPPVPPASAHPRAGVPQHSVEPLPASPPARSAAPKPQFGGAVALAHAEPVDRGWRAWHWSAWVLLAWLAGAFLMAAPLVVGTLRVWRMVRRAQPMADGAWQDLLVALSRQLALRRTVRLVMCDRTVMPLTWGLGRTVALLPASAEGWPDDRRRIVLLHELAHAKRWDCLTQMLAQVVRALYWFNPLAWLAVRRLHVERERACDDLVLTHGFRACDYAEHLLAFVRSLRSPSFSTLAAVGMARRSRLEQRLREILDTRRNRRSLTRTALFVVLVAATCVVPPLAALRLAPRADAKAETPVTRPAAEGVRPILDQLGLTPDQEAAVKAWLAKQGPKVEPARLIEFLHTILNAEQWAALQRLVAAPKGPELVVRTPGLLEWGQAVNGLQCALIAPDERVIGEYRILGEKGEMPMGSKVPFDLHLRFDPKAADAKTNLLNRSQGAWKAKLTFTEVTTGKVFERLPFDVGMERGADTGDIQVLPGVDLAPERLDMNLLSEKGEQVPPGVYRVVATYENTAEPEVEVYVAADGLVRTRPYRGPWTFWKGTITSTPIILKVTPAEPETVDLEVNSGLAVETVEGRLFWRWSEVHPWPVRVTRRPGYQIGKRYTLHFVLSGEKIDETRSGLGTGTFRGGEAPGSRSALPEAASRRALAGEPLSLIAEVEVFETAVPVQHSWNPEAGDFRVLWKGTAEGAYSSPATRPAVDHPGRFPDGVTFINNLRFGPANGATGTLKPEGWIECGQPGAVSKVSWRYLRTTADGDIYSLSRTFPSDTPNPTTTEKTVTYAGVPVVVFEDQVQRVVLLPKKLSSLGNDQILTAADLLPLLREVRSVELEFDMSLMATPRALPALTAVLHNAAKPEDVPYVAIIVLGRIGTREAREVLIEALSKTTHPALDDGRSAWSRLVNAVARCIERESDQELLDDLGHKQAEVRWLAAMNQGKRKVAAAAPALIRLLDDKHPDPRLGATWALGEIQDPKGIDELIAIVEKRRAGGSRVSAIEAMGKVRSPRCLQALKSVKADDPDYWMAEKTLAGLSDPPAPAERKAEPAAVKAAEDRVEEARTALKAATTALDRVKDLAARGLAMEEDREAIESNVARKRSRVTEAEAELLKLRGGDARAADLTIAVARLDAARTQLDTTQRQLRRTGQLFSRGVVSQSDLDAARLKAAEAEAEVTIAEAEVLKQRGGDALGADLATAQARLSLARVRLEAALKDLERVKQLVQTGVASRQDLDAAVARAEKAKSDLAVAEKEVLELRQPPATRPAAEGDSEAWRQQAWREMEPFALRLTWARTDRERAEIAAEVRARLAEWYRGLEVEPPTGADWLAMVVYDLMPEEQLARVRQGAAKVLADLGTPLPADASRRQVGTALAAVINAMSQGPGAPGDVAADRETSVRVQAVRRWALLRAIGPDEVPAEEARRVLDRVLLIRARFRSSDLSEGAVPPPNTAQVSTPKEQYRETFVALYRPQTDTLPDQWVEQLRGILRTGFTLTDSVLLTADGLAEGRTRLLRPTNPWGIREQAPAFWLAFREQHVEQVNSLLDAAGPRLERMGAEGADQRLTVKDLDGPLSVYADTTAGLILVGPVTPPGMPPRAPQVFALQLVCHQGQWQRTSGAGYDFSDRLRLLEEFLHDHPDAALVTGTLPPWYNFGATTRAAEPPVEWLTQKTGEAYQAAMDMGHDLAAARKKPARILNAEEIVALGERRAAVEEYLLQVLTRGGGAGAGLLLADLDCRRALPLLRKALLADRYFYGWERTRRAAADYLQNDEFPQHVGYIIAMERLTGKPLAQAVALTDAERQALETEAATATIGGDTAPWVARWLLAQLDAGRAAAAAPLRLAGMRVHRPSEGGRRWNVWSKIEPTGAGHIVGLASRLESYAEPDGGVKRVSAQWQEADAEELDYGKASLDVTRFRAMLAGPSDRALSATLRLRAAVADRIQRLTISDFQIGRDMKVEGHGYTFTVRAALGEALGTSPATFITSEATVPAELKSVQDAGVFVPFCRLGFLQEDGTLWTPGGRGRGGLMYIGQNHAGRTLVLEVPLGLRLVEMTVTVPLVVAAETATRPARNSRAVWRGEEGAAAEAVPGGVLRVEPVEEKSTLVWRWSFAPHTPAPTGRTPLGGDDFPALSGGLELLASPDGKHLAVVSECEACWDLAVYDLALLLSKGEFKMLAEADAWPGAIALVKWEDGVLVIESGQLLTFKRGEGEVSILFPEVQRFAVDSASGQVRGVSEGARAPVGYFTRQLRRARGGEKEDGLYYAATALAQLKAVESLPALRAELAARTDPTDQEVLRRAIDLLSAVQGPATGSGTRSFPP
jgi:beta-lactamase regulating signal transducer with metallopeptidase domain/multidrug resistance efflux pump